MDAMDAIFTRRSIRKYKPGTVDRKTIKELLRAAMTAPSAANQQPWHFVVIDDPEVLRRVPECHPYADMVPQASVAILVCGDLKRDVHEGFWVQDCSAATENLLLAITAHGLGGVWLGVYPRQDRVEGLRRLLGIPNHVVPLALVPIGRPGEKKGRASRYKENRIHRNRW
jgi:nitroreductase